MSPVSSQDITIQFNDKKYDLPKIVLGRSRFNKTTINTKDVRLDTVAYQDVIKNFGFEKLKDMLGNKDIIVMPKNKKCMFLIHLGSEHPLVKHMIETGLNIQDVYDKILLDPSLLGKVTVLLASSYTLSSIFDADQPEKVDTPPARTPHTHSNWGKDRPTSRSRSGSYNKYSKY